MRLMINTIAMAQYNFPLKACTIPQTNENAIIGYKIDQITPIINPGGVYTGFMSASYQTLQVDSDGIWLLLTLPKYRYLDYIPQRQ